MQTVTVVLPSSNRPLYLYHYLNSWYLFINYIIIKIIKFQLGYNDYRSTLRYSRTIVIQNDFFSIQIKIHLGMAASLLFICNLRTIYLYFWFSAKLSVSCFLSLFCYLWHIKHANLLISSSVYSCYFEYWRIYPICLLVHVSLQSEPFFQSYSLINITMV